MPKTKTDARIPHYSRWIETPEVLKRFPKIPAVIVAEVMRQSGTDVNATRHAAMKRAYEEEFGVPAPVKKPRPIRVAELTKNDPPETH